MKKALLFTLSIMTAFGITFYIKRQESNRLAEKSIEWKTFVKKSDQEIASHHTTKEEFIAAKIPTPTLPSERGANNNRAPSSVPNPFKGFMVRNNRVLMGDIDLKYEDENTELKMVNKINPDWKEVMGNDLMRFQPESTKLMVKEELSVIKIEDSKGRFLEQVLVTYLRKDGEKNSFKALVDSETGSVVETWDRTIQEKIGKTGGKLTFPTANDSGIITR